MPYEPALTAIAAATNDALTEHLWRYDTADPGPLGKLTIALAAAASRFNATTTALARALDQNVVGCLHLSENIAKHATVDQPIADNTPPLPQLIERFTQQRGNLLSLYLAWRHHRSLNRVPGTRHLLTVPYQPSHGMVILTCDNTSDRWQVTADSVATDACAIAQRPGTLLGDLHNSADGWQTRSYSSVEHPDVRPDLVHTLPVADSEAAACRALLRWTARRHTPGQIHDPAELTAAQQADLTA